MQIRAALLGIQLYLFPLIVSPMLIELKSNLLFLSPKQLNDKYLLMKFCDINCRHKKTSKVLRYSILI